MQGQPFLCFRQDGYFQTFQNAFDGFLRNFLAYQGGCFAVA
ncbi:hypothetical protein Barb4_03330 [Bacteroidales bacterium Barb4]|nr:hypothetical protein Barb4_03330 [Bacteroidales bacterium Barb4]